MLDMNKPEHMRTNGKTQGYAAPGAVGEGRDLFTSEPDRKNIVFLTDLISARARNMFSHTIKFTPAMAQYVLDKHNGDNRTLSPSRVEKYANEMKYGNFILTAQGISFGKNGLLNNGQHRLAAVVRSRITVEFYVTFGEDRAAFSVIDTSAARTGGDILSIMKYKNANNLAAAARSLFSIEDGLTSKRKFGLTNNDVLSFVESHPKLPDAVSASQSIFKKFRCTTASVAPAIYIILTKSRRPDMMVAFSTALIDGSGLEKNSPLLKLRDGLQTKTIGLDISDSYSKNIMIAASIVLTWNKWLKNRSGGISWKASSPFPSAE
jgi:hypothetical protein